MCVMFEGIVWTLRRHWLWVLGVAALVAYVVNVFIFYPGYMSNDSLGHLGQATGIYPVSDLTPPVMTMLWRALIGVTGHVSAMLLFQLGMLWAALLLFGLYVWHMTESRKWSLLPLAIGCLPFVLNISGVIWKDNQMVFALALAVSLTFCSRYISRTAWRLVVLSIAVLFVAYAGLVRYNAIIALVPVLFMVVRAARLQPRVRLQAVAVGAICVIIGALFPLVNIAMKATQSHPVSAIMLDDIVNVASAADITHASQASDLKTGLLRVQQCAAEKRVVLNNFWVCANDDERRIAQFSRYEDVKSLWLHTVAHKPLQYALYRTHTFFLFLFIPEGTTYIWQDGIVANNLGQQVAVPRAGAVVQIYVQNFAYRHFSFLFEAWFWLAAGIALLVCGWRLRKQGHGEVVLLLSMSSIVYILGYLPTGATSDYRYVYWPVVASLFCGVLILIDWLERRKGSI